ncbi:DUF4336 domain-containing protein [Terrirubrum flagellatum]|uniref:DUF4336 domain-containing protein n=1 Tax=Terrirubrum flagellatum TaxID=2895980 RepID=UPI003CC827A6
MLEEFGAEIWTAAGSDVTAALGFHYPTRMAVIRLTNGDLFIWSPIALTDRLREEVDSLGRVRHLVAPNSLHHLFIGDWKRAYPDAYLYAAPGLREKRRDIDFDHDLANAPPPLWLGQIDQALIPGNVITTEIVFFHAKSGSVLFTDLLQQLPPNWFSGWRAVIAKWDLMVASEPSVPRKFRLAFTDRNAARAAIRQVLSWPAEKVLMAHGAPVSEGAGALLRRAFRWLNID